MIPRVMHNNSAQLKAARLRPPRPGPPGEQPDTSTRQGPPPLNAGTDSILAVPNKYYVHPSKTALSVVLRRSGRQAPARAIATMNSRDLTTPFESISEDFDPLGGDRLINFVSRTGEEWPLQVVISQQGLIWVRWRT